MTDMLPVPEIGGQHAISQTDGRLAWEIAAEIATIPEILTRYGISAPDFKVKLQDPMFRRAIREAKSLWKSDLNVQQRIRIKAAFLVEDSLLDVFKIIKTDNMPAAAKIEAFEKLLKTADLLPKQKDNGGMAAGFKITIIRGDTADERVTINAAVAPAGALTADG